MDWDYNKNLRPPTSYTYGSSKKVYWECHICNSKWEARISNRTFLNRGCPNCSNQKARGRPSARKKSHAFFIEEVHSLVKEEYSVLGEYDGTDKYILMKHNVCENEWMVKPQSFLRGTRCPRCDFSKGESKIEMLLKYFDAKFFPQIRFRECRDKYPLPFDFYLPDYNLIIEYDGKQHFEPVDFSGQGISWSKRELKEIKKKDKIKTKYCKDNNINLLRIPYWEFDNIEEILEQTLSRLG